MFWRKRAPSAARAAAVASYKRAVADADEQREKLLAESDLRARLLRIRAKNHLAAELLAVLSERRQ